MSLCILHTSTQQQGFYACVLSYKGDHVWSCGSSFDAGPVFMIVTNLVCGRASRVVAVVGAGHVPGVNLVVLPVARHYGHSIA